MKKLSLKLDELRVESFATDDDGDGRGTVRGHVQSIDHTECPVLECYSYGGTCGASPPSDWYRDRNTARYARTADCPTRNLYCCV